MSFVELKLSLTQSHFTVAFVHNTFGSPDLKLVFLSIIQQKVFPNYKSLIELIPIILNCLSSPCL